MNTIFFGSSKYVLPLIEKLSQEFDISLVVTTEKKETDAVPKYCLEHHIPFESVTSIKTDAFLTEIRDFGADFAVLADFGLIIPKELIHIFPKGIVNIHPSLLPKFRGSTPGQSAILAGLQETGVSIMLLDEQLDHGPILAQEKAVIEPTDTADTLYTRLFTIGSELLAKTIHPYLDNSLTPKQQDDTQATVTKILTKESGFVDLSSLPTPDTLQLMIRAYSPWPGVWTKMMLYGKEKIVKLLPSSSHPELISGSSPVVLQVEGKKPMTAKDFLNGYPEAKQTVEKLHIV